METAPPARPRGAWRMACRMACRVLLKGLCRQGLHAGPLLQHTFVSFSLRTPVYWVGWCPVISEPALLRHYRVRGVHRVPRGPIWCVSNEWAPSAFPLGRDHLHTVAEKQVPLPPKAAEPANRRPRGTARSGQVKKAMLAVWAEPGHERRDQAGSLQQCRARRGAMANWLVGVACIATVTTRHRNGPPPAGKGERRDIRHLAPRGG